MVYQVFEIPVFSNTISGTFKVAKNLLGAFRVDGVFERYSMSTYSLGSNVVRYSLAFAIWAASLAFCCLTANSVNFF